MHDVPSRFRTQRRSSTNEHVVRVADIVTSGFQARAFFIVFVVTTVVGAAMVTITVFAMSFMTDFSKQFYLWLKSENRLTLLTKGVIWCIGAVMLIIVYLTDMHAWKMTCFSKVLVTAGGALIITGQLFWEEPLIPLGTYVFLAVFVSNVLTDVAFANMSSKLVAFAEFVSYMLVAAVLAVAWITWAVLDNGQSLKLSNLKAGDLEKEIFLWSRWGSPAVMCMCYFVLGVFAWARSRSYLSNQVSQQGKISLVPELKGLFGIFLALFFMGWIAANIAVQDEALANLVLYASICAMGVMALYLVRWIGIGRLLDLSETNSTLQTIVLFVYSDWMKGLFVLLFGPLIPPFFLFELIHQCIRIRLIKCGVVQTTLDEFELCVKGTAPRFGKMASSYLDSMREWNFASVFSKAIIWALVWFALQVGVSQGLVLFLSWFNEVTEDISLGITFLVLYVFEMALFLFPPVAGVPLYVSAGIVLIPKIVDQKLFGNWFDWHFAIGIANLFAFFLKMSAIAVEQKCIGGCFSNSVKIKRFICVHTPFMKASRYVLSKPGFSLAKSSILVGGPDWPTSVVTGILGLPLCPMLLGSAPVIALILPCGYAAGFLLCLDCEDSLERRGMNQSRANFCLALAAVLQGTATFLFAYFAQDVMDSRADEIAQDPNWCKDPQEDDVLLLVARDEQLAEEWKKKAMWQNCPLWLQVLLFLGDVSSTLLMACLLNPVQPPFVKFTLDKKISDPPLNGDASKIVRPLGWFSIGLAGFIALIVTVFYLWVSYCASPVDFEEGLEMIPGERSSVCRGTYLAGFEADGALSATPSLPICERSVPCPRRE